MKRFLQWEIKLVKENYQKAAGVSVVPGGLEIVPDVKEAMSQAKIIGYPLMVKASAGGKNEKLLIMKMGLKQTLTQLWTTEQSQTLEMKEFL